MINYETKENSIFKFKNLPLLVIFLFSILIIFINNINLNKILVILSLVSSIFIINNNQKSFIAFLIMSVAWGASINLKYRFGNIMPADISMIIFLSAILIGSLKGNIRLSNSLCRRENLLMIIIVISYIAIGIIKKYSFYNIFQDLKLFIYVFLPYIYVSSIDINSKFKNNIILFIKIYIILIFCQEIAHFKNIGLQNMVQSGFGKRDVAIIVQFVPLAISMLLANKAKINSFEMIFLQILGFLACLLSFTRTIWIAYIMGILITVLFRDKNIFKLFRNILVISIILVVANYILKEFFPIVYCNFYDAVVSRLTDSTNPTNTLDHRFNSSIKVFYDKVWRIDSLFGSGFGEIWEWKKAGFIENSILYYIWKYGVFVTSYFVYKIIRNIYGAFRTNIPIIKIISLNMFVFICIGNFSGNLNLYYCMPILSFVFAYRYMKQNYIYD